jgi:uncharacterized protein (TIGR02271 family)
VLKCEGRSSSPLHSRSVRGGELNCRSSTPTFGSTTKLQHIPPDAEASSAEIALHEEQLKVGKRNVVAGQVRLHKIVRTEEVNVPVELKSEHVVIEHIPASAAKGTGTTSFNEERIEIPLSREEAVVEKVISGYGRSTRT